MPDGSDLPQVRPGLGGVAAEIRRRFESKGKGREMPPHMASTSTGALCLENNMPALARGTYAVKGLYSGDYSPNYSTNSSMAERYYEAQADPATRSETKKKNLRFDPVTKTMRPDRSAPLNPGATIEEVPDEEPSTSTSRPPPVQQPRVPLVSAFKPSAPIVEANNPSASTSLPRANPHPSNTEQGHQPRTRLRSNEEITSKDVPKPAAKLPQQYRFTSDLQETADLDSVHRSILESQIVLTLRELLASSPELMKRLTNVTKTRREYVPTAKLGQADTIQVEAALIDDSFGYTGEVKIGSQDNVEDIFVRYCSTITTDTTQFYAMATGRFEGKLGGVSVTFMADCGSELNIVPIETWEASGLPIDNDGARWRLKGINGNPVPLKGCARNAPVEIGGHRFDHHFFVSNSGVGRQDVILGQPWLQWYAANIAYTRSGIMDLTLFSDGHQQGPSVTIRASAPNNERHADRLVMPGGHSRPLPRRPRNFDADSDEDFR
jgi:hypothetical protein